MFRYIVIFFNMLYALFIISSFLLRRRLEMTISMVIDGVKLPLADLTPFWITCQLRQCFSYRLFNLVEFGR